MSENTNNSNKKFLRRLLSLYRDLREGNATWKDINNLRKEYGYSEMSIDSLRRNFQLIRAYDDEGFLDISEREQSVISETRETITTDYEKDTTISEKTISILPQYINNAEELLKAHGFNPQEFELINARNSRWNGSNEEGRVRFSSRITVKPIKGVTATKCKDILEDYFSNLRQRMLDGEVVNFRLGPKHFDSEGDILEVDLADLHLGLYCSEEEVGEKYNTNIAKKRVEDAIRDIEGRCVGRKFRKVVFAVLGDLIHVDNLNNSTTKGTRQDVDSRLHEMFNESLDLMIMAISRLGCIAPIDVVWNSGNHDMVTGWALGKAVEMAFIKDENVHFYNNFTPRKALRYGKVLIGWSHGEEKEQVLARWLQNEYAVDWGKSLYREVHTGHLHHSSSFKSVLEDSNEGVVCRGINSLCPSSSWEHGQGYPKMAKQMQCFVWNVDKGLQEQWYITVN